MSDINRVTLSGNLVRDPDLRTVGDKGTPLCKFSLAVNESRKGGQKVTHYVDCVSWGSTANTIAERFNKGRQIFLEGRLNMEKWKAQDGSNRSKLSVTVDNFAFPQRVETDSQPYDAGSPPPAPVDDGPPDPDGLPF